MGATEISYLHHYAYRQLAAFHPVPEKDTWVSDEFENNPTESRGVEVSRRLKPEVK